MIMYYLIYKSTDLCDNILLGNEDKCCYIALTEQCLKNKMFNWLINLARHKNIFIPLLLKLIPPFHHFYKIKHSDTIIVFDIADLIFVHYLKRCLPINCNLHIYYWNPLSKLFNEKASSAIYTLKSWGYKISTFDIADSRKYRISYKLPFIRNIGCKSEDIIYDYYFLGNPKGRESIIKDITRTLKDQGLKGLCIIPYKKGDYISYMENIHNIKRSRIIIEVTQEGQSNITLRALEAQLYKKKLITTCEYIKSYDFYSPQNVYIWNKEKKGLNKFVLSKYEHSDKDYMQKYSFASWIDTFN